MSKGAAIIGFAGQFPGAPCWRDLWHVVSSMQPATRPVPDDRPTLLPWAEPWQIKAGFLTDVTRFEAGFFGIAPKEAKALDPQQRLILQTAWHAIEDAGLTLESLPRRTGVFVGVISGDYGTFAQEHALDGTLPMRGTDHYQTANRISYHFDLHGPSIAVDTACSGSGAAIHQAMLALEAGDCDLAIVGGVNLFLHASRFAQFRQLGIISDDNLCRPFREGANGTVYGEGVGLMLLKPVDAAQRDGDNMHGILKGSAVNSGGKTQGFTVPSAKAQTDVVRAALKKAGVSAKTIDTIEAHGTGTALGDPIEVRGLNDAFSADGVTAESRAVPLGSVKGHVGHLESAAAMAGIAKLLLQMHHGKLAPSLPGGAANRLIKFNKTPFALQDSLEDWATPPRRKPYRALLSTFGAGGVNASMVIESAPKEIRRAEAAYPGVFLFSARSEQQLKSVTSDMLAWLSEQGEAVCLHRLANTLQNGRTAFGHRLAVLAEDAAALVSGLKAFAEGQAHDDIMSGARIASLAEAFQDPSQNGDLIKALPPGQIGRQMAALWVNGVELDWSGGRARAELPQVLSIPGYPFAGECYWLDEGALRTQARDVRQTGFLRNCVRPALSEQAIFQTSIGTKATPSLAHHKLFDQIVVPGSYYIALAATASRDLLGRHGFDLVDAAFLEGLTCQGDEIFDVQCLIDAPDTAGHRQLRIASRRHDQSEWRLHFRAQLVETASAVPIETPAKLSDATTVGPDEFYKQGLKLGFKWSGPYRAIKTLELGANRAVATIDSGETPEDATDGAQIHPATLDAVFQVALASLPEDAMRDAEAFMPLGVRRVRVFADVQSSCTSRFSVVPDDSAQSKHFNGVVHADDGAVAMEFEGLTVLRVGADNLERLRARAQSVAQVPDILVPALQHAKGGFPTPNVPISVYPMSRTKALSALCEMQQVHCVSRLDDAPRGALNLIFALEENGDQSSGALAEQAEELVNEIKAVLDDLAARSVRLWIVGAAQDAIGSAAFVAFVRSLAWELPTLRPTSVVYDEPLTPIAAELLVGLFAAAPDEDQWTLSASGLSVSRLTKPQSQTTQPKSIAGTQCVVTGGASGLGLLHVDWLLTQGARRIVVLGRSAPPQDGGLPDTLETIAKAHGDAQVLYRAVDVSDMAAVNRVFEEEITIEMPLGFVVHAAGVIDDGAFGNLNRDRFDALLKVKLNGMKNLASAAAGHPNAQLIAMSSATALLGAPGQTNYAMANAAMDAFCGKLRDDGVLVTNVNWGPWQATGMTARLENAKGAKATSGQAGALVPASAPAIFEQVYGRAGGQYMVVPANWRKFAAHYGRGPLPSIWCMDTEPPKTQVSAASRDTASPVPGSLDARSAMMEAMREVLGYPSPDSFDWNAPFTEIGIDSLSAIALRDQLCSLTGAVLNTTIVYDFPTANRLVEHLKEACRVETATNVPECPAGSDSAAQAIADEVEDLNESEANLLLAEELSNLGLLDGETL